jgi:predicted Rossmann fold nucleotide-binding protein DprA/Smf involved in DNA uptake
VLVGVVGTRGGGFSSAVVSRVVGFFASRGWAVATGGALGVDSCVLSSLLSLGLGRLGVVFSAWSSVAGFPVSVRPLVSRLLSSGGRVVWGVLSPPASRRRVLSALFSRNRALASSCDFLVAFLAPGSCGSLAVISACVRRGVPVVVFPYGCSLPPLSGGSWVACSSGVFAGGFRWVPSQLELFE